MKFHFLFPLFLSLIVGFSSSCCIIDNLHPMDGARAYRSGQMSTSRLARTIEKHKIRTVINLRGPSPDKEWYREEVATCKKHGVEHYSIRFSARSLPYRDRLLRLLKVYRTAHYPILIHCQGGADRTSLASVYYRMTIKGEPLEKALDQMNLMTYCHLPIGSTSSMDWFFEIYEEEGRKKGKDIETWIREDYRRSRYYPDGDD